MEVTALCIRLLVDVFVLLAAQVDHSYSAQKADAVFLRIDPNRLQFSEYESFSVTCEGTDGASEWRVMRKLQKALEANSSSNTCISLEPSCTFDPAFETDSGEYWCENKDGETSDTVNIIVVGSVMLELPEQPVMEGDDVILRCINKTAKSKDTVVFYKDGVYLETRYDNMIYTIKNVSKYNEGLYKCSIPGYAESPEMWLAVEKQKTVGSVMLELPEQPVMEGDDVILRCINKKTESKDTVVFYKDGVYLETQYDNMIYTIQNVSKSNEGFYKCSIPGYAESPEMWLAVEKQNTEPRDHHSSPVFVFLWTVVTVLSVDLLLLVMSVKLCSIYRERQMSKRSTKPNLQEDGAICSSVIYRPLTPN